jgi:hypothetical protein
VDENPMSSAGWATIQSLLPKNWAQRAEELRLCRSIRSATGEERAKLRDPGTLLRLVLHHVQTGSSLDQTVTLAAAAKLVDVSSVGLHYRMRAVGPWLSEMAAQMIGAPEMFDAARWAGFRIFCTDATTGTRPGAMGTTFRVHYRIHAQTLRPEQAHFTDDKGGETLRNFTIRPGDLDLVDRAYCTPPSIAHAVTHGGDLLVRYNRGTLPLRRCRTRQPFDVETWVLGRRTRDHVRSRQVIVDCEDGAVFGRVIAIRLPKAQAKKARRRTLKEKGKDTPEHELLWSEYLVVFTTVPANVLPDAAILALYRLRWQVELHIKRDKSIGGLDRLPNFRPDTIEGWVSAKLLLGALARRLVCEAFSPEAGPHGRSPAHAA